MYICVYVCVHMRQERQQQRAYNAVVAREEAQNERYTEEEAQYRKIRAHSYQQQLQGFLRFLIRHNTLMRHNTFIRHNTLIRHNTAKSALTPSAVTGLPRILMKIWLTELC